MIETAIEVTEGRVAGRGHPGDPGVRPRDAAPSRRDAAPCARDAGRSSPATTGSILITKGDLFDQERKLAQSGLGELFDAVEIVSDKNASTYQRVFSRHGDGPERSMMVGNSLKSDVRAGDRGGQLGRLCAPRSHLGARARPTGGRGALPPDRPSRRAGRARRRDRLRRLALRYTTSLMVKCSRETEPRTTGGRSRYSSPAPGNEAPPLPGRGEDTEPRSAKQTLGRRW